jgi:prepilin-type N-terminal cleavage/methylation domain-containing protein
MTTAVNEHGFSLIEVMIAAAVFVVMMGTAFAAVVMTGNVMRGAATTQRGADAIDRQAAEFRAEAATASAVFVPPLDMNGAPNADGHEVDFYSKSQANLDVFRRYIFDPATATLRRYDYDPKTNAIGGVRDPRTGAIDATATYPAIPEVTAFSARFLEASDLADPGKNRYAPLFSRVPNGEPVSLNDPAGGRDVAGLVGGNRIVEIQLANRKASRVVHLAAGTMPTGFYVGGNIKYHTVLYRIDQSHRFWFGAAGKSHVWIRGRASITYDDWATAPRVWCDYAIYGGDGGNGLDPSDPHADYRALRNDIAAQPQAILNYCEQHATLPGRVASYAVPNPYQTPFSIVDTPPPCWTNPGTGEHCWPAGAPVDWAPSPLPADTPPPQWCAAHARSTACGAPANVPATLAPSASPA